MIKLEVDNLKSLNKKKIVITGANGYLGSALYQSLKKLCQNIICVTSQNEIFRGGAQYLVADINKASTWEKIIDADIIYHLAGNTSIVNAEKEPLECLQSTLLPLIHINNLCLEKKKKPRIIFSSTATIYGLQTIFPVSETATRSPITNYDLHKLYAEEHLVNGALLGLYEVVIFRFSNIYGPSVKPNGSRDRGIINSAAKSAVQGKTLTLYDDGMYIRDYLYISDLIDGLIKASISNRVSNNTYNLCSGVGTSIRNVFELISESALKLHNRKIVINSIPMPQSYSEIDKRNFIGCYKKFEDHTGWTPKISIASGVDMLMRSN